MTANDSVTGEERVIRRVQKLLEFAGHEATSDVEKKRCMDLADTLMLDHAIDMAKLEASGQGHSEIVRRDWESPTGDFSGHLMEMMEEVARSCRLQSRVITRAFAVVGHEADIQYGELLWATILREFVSSVDPGWVPEQGLDWNVKRLKEAGRAWAEIGRMANANGHPGGTNPGQGGWLKSAYNRQCRREGVEATNHTQRHGAYRRSFADAFTNRISQRLRDRDRDRQAYIDERSDDNTLLPALRSAQQRVQQEFWNQFPDLHPDEKKRRQEALEADYQRRMEEFNKWWEGLTEEEKQKHRREEERRGRRAERDYQQYQFRNRTEPAGATRGREAANRVDMHVGGNRVGGKGELE